MSPPAPERDGNPLTLVYGLERTQRRDLRAIGAGDDMVSGRCIPAALFVLATVAAGAGGRQEPGRTQPAAPVPRGGMEAEADPGERDAGGFVVAGPVLAGNRIVSIAVAPTSPLTLYAGGDVLFRSTDGGETWSQVGSGLEGWSATFLVVDPWMPTTVWACTGAGLIRSTDSGGSWTRWNAAGWDTTDSAQVLAIDPAVPDRLFAVAGECSHFGMGDVCDVTLRRSDDGGGSWRGLAGAILAGGLALQPRPPRAVFFGMLNSEGSFLRRSVDGGDHWLVADTMPTGVWMLAVAVAPPGSSGVLAGTTAGVRRSDDGGATWADASLDPACGSVRELLFDPNRGDRAFARTDSCGLLVSEDAGSTWTPLALGDPSLPPTCLAVSPGSPTRLWVGTNDGVYSVRLPVAGRAVRRHVSR